MISMLAKLGVRTFSSCPFKSGSADSASSLLRTLAQNFRVQKKPSFLYFSLDKLLPEDKGSLFQSDQAVRNATLADTKPFKMCGNLISPNDDTNLCLRMDAHSLMAVSLGDDSRQVLVLNDMELIPDPSLLSLDDPKIWFSGECLTGKIGIVRLTRLDDKSFSLTAHIPPNTTIPFSPSLRFNIHRAFEYLFIESRPHTIIADYVSEYKDDVGVPLTRILDTTYSLLGRSAEFKRFENISIALNTLNTEDPKALRSLKTGIKEMFISRSLSSYGYPVSNFRLPRNSPSSILPPHISVTYSRQSVSSYTPPSLLE